MGNDSATINPSTTPKYSGPENFINNHEGNATLNIISIKGLFLGFSELINQSLFIRCVLFLSYSFKFLC
jgi:hypothetical protein